MGGMSPSSACFLVVGLPFILCNLLPPLGFVTSTKADKLDVDIDIITFSFSFRIGDSPLPLALTVFNHSAEASSP